MEPPFGWGAGGQQGSQQYGGSGGQQGGQQGGPPWGRTTWGQPWEPSFGGPPLAKAEAPLCQGGVAGQPHVACFWGPAAGEERGGALPLQSAGRTARIGRRDKLGKRHDEQCMIKKSSKTAAWIVKVEARASLHFINGAAHKIQRSYD
jgi:hypothetical protein